MLDKRPFYALLNEIKTSNNDSIPMIESIEEGFSDIASISDTEKRALKLYPIQFVKRIKDDQDEWTTQLHIWAENGVPDILDLDPTYLAFKNSYGDTVLMAAAVGASGTHTGKTDYDLVEKLISGEYIYDDITVNPDDKESKISKNALDETDINGFTPIDYLLDIAYGIGEYDGEEPDIKLQQMLSTHGFTPETTNEEPETPDEESVDVTPSTFSDFL